MTTWWVYHGDSYRVKIAQTQRDTVGHQWKVGHNDNSNWKKQTNK